ncbi:MULTISPECIES: ABC transporter permease [Streptomyces]|uniref:ABC transporter permease n=1 Tax=Streptomyces TaxID=1883 RepID=UPI0004CB6A59|nr:MULTISPECIES: ABC transporter permease [unclassified Streptomyces]KJY21388.1 ABC transporter permease [Streptomyces sp. NRRL S-104]
MTRRTAEQPPEERRAAGLAGTGVLLRLALRRDRVMMPVWILATTLLVAGMPGSLGSVYATAAERAEVAASMNANGSMRALYGPVFGDSLGGLTAWRAGVFGAVLAAVMSLIIVVRHTREEEETGRQEMLSAAMVGRRAPLTAALLAALVANTCLALLVAGGLAGQGAPGAAALGLALAGTGMLFAGTAAVAAQLTESARAAKGLTAAVLGAAFVLKAAGDAGTADGRSALTWLSPLGWVENVRAFAVERWWVLLLLAAAVGAQVGAGYLLAGRRDLGMSFLPSRPGPARGRLGSAGALAWRLQRGTLAGWSAGFLTAGAVFGGMADGAADLVGGNDRTREIIERMGGQSGLTDAFLATMAGMFGMVAALYAVSAVLRLSGEESAHRAEPLLALPVGRLRWAGGHLAVAFGGSALILLLAGLGLGLGHGGDVRTTVAATLAQLPAVWVIGALAALLHGALPAYAAAAWAVAGGALALGWVGPALDLPQGVLDLSPFAHLPRLPGAESLSWAPLLALTALAAALTAAGLTALRRRDLTS